MVQCERAMELISAQLDGALTGTEARELEAHLALCPACRALEEQMSAIHAAFPDLEELAAPEGFARGVMERVQAQEAKKAKVTPFLRRPQVRALAGLAACAVLCVGLYRGGMLPNKNGAPSLAMAASGVEADSQARSEGAYSSDTPTKRSAEEGPGIAPFAMAPDGAGENADAVPNAALYDGTDALVQPEADAVLTLTALPEGADEVILPETACSPAAQGGTLYYLSPQQLEALERLAREQGIQAVRAQGAGGGTDVLCVLVLEP